MKTNKETKIQNLNFFYNITVVVGIIMSVLSGLLLIVNSQDIFIRFLATSFKKIPFIGTFLLSYLKSINIINIELFSNQVFKPILSLDVLYFIASFLIFQTTLLLLKRYILKHDQALITSIITIILSLSLLLRTQELLHISKLFTFDSVSSISNMLKIFYLIQFITLILIMFTLYKEGKLDYHRLLNHQQIKYYTTTGIKITLLLFTLISLSLVSVKSIINSYKESYHIDYRLEFIPQENNKLSLKVPDSLSQSLARAGITLPKEIDENTLLNQLGIQAVDLGSIINSSLDDTIDNATYSIIQRPFNISISGVLIMLLLIIEVFITKKINLQSLIVQSFETILLGYLFLGPSHALTTLLTLALGFTFFSSFMNLIIMIRDGHYFKKTMIKLKGISQ